MHHAFLTRDSSVTIVPWSRLDARGIVVRFSSWELNSFLLECPQKPCGPCSIIFDGYWEGGGVFSLNKEIEALSLPPPNATYYRGMCGTVPLFPYTPSWPAQGHIYLSLIHLSIVSYVSLWRYGWDKYKSRYQNVRGIADVRSKRQLRRDMTCEGRVT
jgi:hypothetical protein